MKTKPSKPYADFPLYAHGSGQWAKKIRGKLHYFGAWQDWRAALDLYLDQRDDLQAGRKPRASRNGEGGPRVKDLINQFLNDKQTLVGTGEMSRRTWDDYHKAAVRIVDTLGRDRRLDDIRPSDFATLRESYPDGWGITTLGNEIARARVIFNYATALALVDKPIAFGPLFRRPSRKAQRIARAKKPKKLFDAETIRAMVDNSTPTLRAMILLGINCGLGNRDCASLTRGHLRGDWLEYPRPKTGVDRRAKLWPETAAAIFEVEVDGHRARVSPSDRVFLTRYGRPWLSSKSSVHCPISQQTRKLLKGLGRYREGLSFYALRHTFQTIGERSGDLVAVSSIMGHVDSSMSGNYREEITDERLENVAETVRKWLFENNSKKKPDHA